jgi:hypothetical protein
MTAERTLILATSAIDYLNLRYKVSLYIYLAHRKKSLTLLF